MSMEISLLLLLVCGAAMGYFGGRLLRGRATRKEGRKLSFAKRRQLQQLQAQRESGLLTQKEYAARKKALLKD